MGKKMETRMVETGKTLVLAKKRFHADTGPATILSGFRRSLLPKSIGVWQDPAKGRHRPQEWVGRGKGLISLNTKREY